MDLSIILKEKKLEREVYITGLPEVTVQGGCLIEIFTSTYANVFAMDIIGSTTRPIIVNKLVVIVLNVIMTPLLVSLDMCALAIPYLFDV